MRTVGRPLALVAAAALVVGLAGACTAAPGGSASLAAAAATASPAASSPPTATAPVSSPMHTGAPSATGTPTPVDMPIETPAGTTQTPWGRIVDAVPSAFPVFPGAMVADPPVDGPVSGAWLSNASVGEVASWYRDALQAANYAKVDLGSALEDGSRVLDIQGDLPECKAQVTVKPQGGSTLITVLYGAGCAAGDS